MLGMRIWKVCFPGIFDTRAYPTYRGIWRFHTLVYPTCPGIRTFDTRGCLTPTSPCIRRCHTQAYPTYFYRVSMCLIPRHTRFPVIACFRRRIRHTPRSRVPGNRYTRHTQHTRVLSDVAYQAYRPYPTDPYRIKLPGKLPYA